MTVVWRTLVTILAARFLTGNLGRGFALMTRGLLSPRLLAALVAPRSARIRSKTRARSLGGEIQDRAC
jgi:hypothetical protein